MFEKAIPQYHLSYTEEENRSMHEYLFSVKCYNKVVTEVANKI